MYYKKYNAIVQYSDQSHLGCVEHGFEVNKTHTSIKKTTH